MCYIKSKVSTYDRNPASKKVFIHVLFYLFGYFFLIRSMDYCMIDYMLSLMFGLLVHLWILYLHSPFLLFLHLCWVRHLIMLSLFWIKFWLSYNCIWKLHLLLTSWPFISKIKSKTQTLQNETKNKHKPSPQQIPIKTNSLKQPKKTDKLSELSSKKTS